MPMSHPAQATFHIVRRRVTTIQSAPKPRHSAQSYGTRWRTYRLVLTSSAYTVVDVRAAHLSSQTARQMPKTKHNVASVTATLHTVGIRSELGFEAGTPKCDGIA